jgi:hypothetical protein
VHAADDPDAIVKAITATTAAELRQISDWTHDAFLLAANGITYSRQHELVEVRFQQEPLDRALALPQRQLARKSWWATDCRLPYVLCRLRVRGVVADPTTPTGLDSEETLVGVDWDAQTATLRIHTAIGPIRVRARQLRAELLITSHIVNIRRRRVGRVIPYDSTSGPL